MKATIHPPLSVCKEQVYDSLYRSHAEKLRNHLYYKCGGLAKAEDLMQESFIRLWKKCKEVMYEKALGFLYTVSNRLFIDLVRKKNVLLKFEKSQLPKINTEDPFFQLRTKEFREKIQTEISRLPDGQQEAFLLNRIDKLTYREIAATLEISETAVEKRIAKALLKLRAVIGEFKEYNI